MSPNPAPAETDVGAPASRDDAGLLARLLAEAFHDDPLTRWITPDEERRAALLPGFFGVFLDMSYAYDAVVTTPSRDAVLTYLPPGAWEELERDGARYEEAFAAVLGPDAERLAAISALQAERHPADRPHYYLAFGAVRPEARGARLLTALVEQITARADAEGYGLYTEASSPGGEASCLRNGYVPVGPRIELPDGGPTLRPLWRDPR
ncbi:hypothetical protein ABT160_36775 [Streptomyces sp. NPDC001941]|uniref:hypothetical protein n=1 Tax=Streptomyces sp. NPDC001941 TaxID=3154659 RepID=UPI003326EF90